MEYAFELCARDMTIFLRFEIKHSNENLFPCLSKYGVCAEQVLPCLFMFLAFTYAKIYQSDREHRIYFLLSDSSLLLFIIQIKLFLLLSTYFFSYYLFG